VSRRRHAIGTGGTLLGLLTLLLGLALGGATAASAHAALLSTTPGQGSVVATAPKEVVLHFSEQVTLPADALRVFDPAGARVDTGSATHAAGNPSTSEIALRSGLGRGTYTVSWRAISADTHPVSGAWTFSIGAPSATTPVAGESAPHGDAVVGGLYGAARFVQYLAFALLAGAGALVLGCWPRGAGRRGIQRLLLTGWIALLVATLAQLLLRGPYEQASGLAKAFDLDLVRASLGERLGTLLVVRILLLAACGAVLAFLQPVLAPEEPDEPHQEAEEGGGAAGARGRAWLGAVGALLAVGLAATWALADHASVGMQVGLAVPVDMVHLLAMAGWLGGLAAVIVGLRRAEEHGGIGPAAVGRFSAVAAWSVTALVASGIYQAWRGLGSWGAFTSTSYGRLLLVKLAGVLVILGTAWLSRRWTALLRERAAAPGAAPAAAAPGPEPAPPADADPAREAQLARQRAARADAAARRAREAVPARGMLLRSTLLEAVFAVAVLVVTTLLTNTAPGRAEAAQSAATAQTQTRPVDVSVPYDTGGTEHGARGTVRVQIDPARAGTPNDVHVYVDDAAGEPVDVPELDLALTLPAQHLGPLAVKVTKVDVGHWAGTGLQIPLAGSWQLSVTVRSSDIDEVTRAVQVRIG